MSASGLTLDRGEVQVLEEERLILGGPTNGKRKVSAALLSPPSSHGTVSSSTSSSSASVKIHLFDASTKAPFDLPEEFESVASLEVIGYTRPAAREIFARWANRPDPQQNPDSLLDYALSNLGRLHYQLNSFPAIQAMTALGISDELQKSLTNPSFSEIFRSQTLHYWLVDTMTIRNSTILKLLKRLKSHARVTVAEKGAEKGDKKRPKLEGVFESAASSSAQPTTTPSVTSSTSAYIKSKSNELPSTYVTVQTKPEDLPDHVTLYKGKAVGDMQRENFIFQDGRINMRSIVTQAGGDFNQHTDAWYFTKEEATAEKHRKWAELRCPQSESWLIQMQVPNSFMDSLRKEFLWFSDEWKEYVWYCRQGATVEDPPERYDKFWKSGGAQLVEGPICSRVPEVVLEIKEEEIKAKITEDFLMKIDGREASQSVMIDREAAAQLGVLIRVSNTINGAYFIGAAPFLFANRHLKALAINAPNNDAVKVPGTGASEIQRIFSGAGLVAVLDTYMVGIKAIFAFSMAGAAFTAVLTFAVPWKRIPHHSNDNVENGQANL